MAGGGGKTYTKILKYSIYFCIFIQTFLLVFQTFKFPKLKRYFRIEEQKEVEDCLWEETHEHLVEWAHEIREKIRTF